jgi:hypothetical protein
VFIFVNLALIAIKHRGEGANDHFSVPLLVPVCGMMTSATLLIASLP